MAQPPSSMSGPDAAYPLSASLDFSQGANRLLLARSTGTPGASCSMSSSSTVAVADASNSVGALKVKSFIFFPQEGRPQVNPGCMLVADLVHVEHDCDSLPPIG